MRFLRYIFVVFVLGIFSLNSSLFANEEVQETNLLEEAVTLSSRKERQNNRGRKGKKEQQTSNQNVIDSNKSKKRSGNQDAGKVYNRISSSKNFQPSKSVFFQTNIGVGFLYFGGLRGNLMGQPSTRFDRGNFRDVPLKGRLSYNRTPLFEYLLGYQFNSWLKIALSYQYQGGIVVQSKALKSFGDSNTSAREQFSSNLSLNGILAKVYFEFPYALILKNFAINPYLAAGVGPGWQSWTQININSTFISGFANSNPFPCQQRLCASAVWMVDLGFRMQKASPLNQFSLVMGCKYNQWGQARNIGQLKHQRSLKINLSQPVRIKTVYQFAPYLGVQWSFSPNQSPGVPFKRKKANMDSIKFQCSSNIWTQFNAGVGLLYFSGLRGGFMGTPSVNFVPQFNKVPLKGRLSYNRTPLLEYLIGYQFNSWLKFAFSYQHQAGVVVQTKALRVTLGNSPNNRVQFTSNLGLDAVLAKFYFDLPFNMILRNISTNPYIAVGAGAGWQSWSLPQVSYMYNSIALVTDPLPLRSRFNANAVWMIDLGLRVQSALPSKAFSVVMGCKYNQWGQARNIGQLSHQESLKNALAEPLRIKTVYQFAPYLGFQWNFSPNKTTGYQLKGKNPNVWLPYWVSSRDFQCPSSIWIQFNAGVGFLYFSNIKGNLMGDPSINLTSGTGEGFRDVPFKGRLSYNVTPLFEYLVGYQFKSWLKLAISYQYQSGVTVATKALQGYDNIVTNYARFTSNLSLNGVLAKVYFELPFSMIWRSLSTNPYLAVGVGPGWQSWTNISVNYIVPENGPFGGEPFALRQKNSANVVWMADAGLRVQSAYPDSKFSVLLGCKYNQWGQARSMGKLSQQGSFKEGLSQPLTVKTVYQIAPYLGVQWNF